MATFVMKIKANYVTGRGKSSKRDFRFLDEHTNLRNPIVRGSANFILNEPLEVDLNSSLIVEHRGDVFFEMQVNGMACIGFRFKDCPLHVLEVISDFNLQEKFNLNMGSECDLELKCHSPNFVKRYFWKFMWGSGQSYYDGDKYIKQISRVRFIYRLACQSRTFQSSRIS